MTEKIKFRKPDIENAKKELRNLKKQLGEICPKCDGINTTHTGDFRNNIPPYFTIKQMMCNDCENTWSD